YASDSGAEALRDKSRVRGIALSCDGQLPFSRRGTADCSDFAVGPILFCDPVELVDSVRERWTENVVVALREEAAALVHLDEHVTTLHGFELARKIARRAVADVPVVEVVRRAHEDRRVFLRRVFGPVDVGSDPDAIAHRNHELALDDRD